MSNLTIHKSRAEFEHDIRAFDVVAVCGTVEGISVSPSDAYRNLREVAQASFILQSKSPENGASRYSYVCPVTEHVLRTGAGEAIGDVDPIDMLRSHMRSRTVAPISDLPEIISGGFGYVAYEAVRHFEPSVGALPPDPTDSPVSAFIFPRELLVFDHLLDQIHIVVFSSSADEFNKITERISNISLEIVTDMISSNALDNTHADSPETPIPAVASLDFQAMVRKAREAIIDGELIQVVLGQRLEFHTTADALDLYKELTALNPSPYMYLLDLGDMQIIGASPELMTRTVSGVAAIHPIAGTRPRGKTAEEDLQYEADLISSEKELAEHVMLVDLSRNDLGRVCTPGTVTVRSLKHVERYSHVMHLVSRIEGHLATGFDGIDAFRAGFPIGTLSGAPKIRSIQLIAELEPEGRGPYCGGIGWFGANGDVDIGTVIRSIVLKKGIAHIQGGAGIVFDSEPESENFESLQKARAGVLAVKQAERKQRQPCERDTPVSRQRPNAATIPAE